MLSLYEATVPGFKQTIGALRDLLTKGRAFCKEDDLDLEALADAALHPAMKPFRFQIVAGLHFSMGSLAALETGRIGVPNHPPVRTYDALETMVDEALARLAEVTPAEIDDRATATVVFEAGGRNPPSPARACCCPSRSRTCTSTRRRPTTSSGCVA